MLNSDNIGIVVKKLTVHGIKVRLLGFLKSVFFQFYKGSFELYAVENGIQGSPIPVSFSTHNIICHTGRHKDSGNLNMSVMRERFRIYGSKLNLIQRSLRQAIILCHLFQFMRS